ncbi:MAG: hypothetical protein JWL83_4307 [Actinomycetia bacterium]|nr:hypothetical protein [Actinomycetes bacterium]
MTTRFGDPLLPQRDSIVRAVDTWVRHPTLSDLATSFGFEEPRGALPDLLRALDDWSLEHWDSRRGGERQTATDTRMYTPQQLALISRAEQDLGMQGGSQPTAGVYDLVAVLGGAWLAPLRRCEYARDALDGRNAEHVALLGSGRALLDGEAEVVAAYARHATNEFDLIVAAAAATFGIDTGRELSEFSTDDPDPRNRSLVRQFHSPRLGVPIAALWAPTSRPGHRANTADTVRFLARVHTPAPGSRVLVVTSPHFVTFQHADVVRDYGLAHCAIVETIGFPTTWHERPVPPHHTLQEIRSAVRSMRNLVEVVACR